MKYTLQLIILILLCSEINYAQEFTLTSSREKSAYGLPCTDFYFDVAVNNIPIRKVKVRRFLPSNSKGTLVLTAGGTGKSSYLATYGIESQIMIDSLYKQKFAIWDIMYEDENGWSEHCEGIGSYHNAVQIYSELVRFLYDNYFENKDLVFATGNSGGSFQIAFGLAKFGMESIFDMVILTGGPPISDLRKGVFGDNSDLEKWPNGVVGGFALTDYLMGWTEERYCYNRMAPDSIISILDTVSLVSSVSERDYQYKTLVNFVQSNDPTNAHHQARLYYNEIESGKMWYDLDLDIHAVPSSQEGAKKIKDLIIQYEEDSKTKITSVIDSNLKVFPNPFNNRLFVDANNDVVEIEVVNALGQTVVKTTETKLNTSRWSAGLFTVTITKSDGHTIVKRLIKE